MKDQRKLYIYDQLREAHKYITALQPEFDWDYIDRCVIEAVDRALYMAESRFARMAD